MCLLIALLLGFAGLFGFAGISSELASPPTPIVVEVTAEAAQVPTQVFSCESVAEDQDIQSMLALVGEAFDPTVWTQTVSSEAAKTTATWQSSEYGAVAYLEYLHYNCGVSQEQIDQYYSPAGFETLLSSYASYELTDQCASKRLKLFEFDAVSNNRNYHVLYWVEQVSPTRVAGLMLVFPTTRPAQQAEFAGRLFPELPTCEETAG